mmetsp:Transcript_33903/g.72377  ORF Transcript_33903/g.72377 Transcript_33903/m.72377 type:complete len:197 (-) Transcript_33903:122-712(-)|eukprot:CAMPEP_0183358036 /NCGR_PEP_ID=MMETSP0164_2-20130417/48014_1 /TAXON_ID=221442 /ORGANISM="Coccolithus pelagicus ssp braarudi, Strain PLY182g" /LENGTH=196 /DNA_ID=CAMNT_0025531829 /DNA_START=143 /DNA_END=733 /DNA_ORIENTATION=-
MPRNEGWGKTKRKAISRHTKGTSQRSGATGLNGVQMKMLKPVSARHTSARVAEPPSVDEAAAQANDVPAAPPAPKPSKPAVHKRKRRDEEPASAKRRKLAKDASKLSRDLGATAEGRHSAFAREGRSDASAERLAQYHTQQAVARIKKLFGKGKTAEAAAVLGGLVRDPDVRQLLAAAGVQLSEDVALDMQLLGCA